MALFFLAMLFGLSQQLAIFYGDKVEVTLELDAGYRNVEVPQELEKALKIAELKDKFYQLIYSKRKEFARQVADAKSPDTKTRRIEKIIAELE